jgi:pilus assembly protein Flp/PilA
MLVSAWLADEAGQGLVEYGLIIGLVAVFVVGVLGALAGAIAPLYSNTATQFQHMGSGG